METSFDSDPSTGIELNLASRLDPLEREDRDDGPYQKYVLQTAESVSGLSSVRPFYADFDAVSLRKMGSR